MAPGFGMVESNAVKWCNVSPGLIPRLDTLCTRMKRTCKGDQGQKFRNTKRYHAFRRLPHTARWRISPTAIADTCRWPNAETIGITLVFVLLLHFCTHAVAIFVARGIIFQFEAGSSSGRVSVETRGQTD